MSLANYTFVISKKHSSLQSLTREVLSLSGLGILLRCLQLLMSVGNKNVLHLGNFSGISLTPYFVRIYLFALQLTADTLSHTANKRLHMHKCVLLLCPQLHKK
jgi:hypothetical protein